MYYVGTVGFRASTQPIYQLSIINYQLSIINYQLSIINYQLSTINYQLSHPTFDTTEELGNFPQ
ncbi:hypothetical protein C7B77_28525 [Chamaesiphon polymorphus CCALA 037]|uniref:Uncharacterized protein n=1 Tax=Chamaesiphon polymorphus CCALA 037 TaxID=2107692 RepID=A0A2T1F5N5_9CYAN|nr:hypothetical protein C7B77_28525 [Chamaesiphon polymorphus CCALA 037]